MFRAPSPPLPAQREPEQLRRGKAFHRLVQAEWKRDAQGRVTKGRGIVKPSGGRGRVDVLVDDEDPDGVVAVVEIKASDWDRMTNRAVRRNVRRQIRQIRSYIESQTMEGKYARKGEGKDVCPGVIFPTPPEDPDRRRLIEEMFLEEGISVVWHDESEGSPRP